MKHNWLIKFILVAICALPIATTAKPKANEQPIDNIVATVNDDVITRSELNAAMQNAKAQMMASQVPLPAQKALTTQVLNQLINRKLQLQLAKQAGLTTTDEMLDKTISKIAKDNNVSVSTLYSKVQEEGLTRETYRNEMRDELTVQQLQRQEIASRITISPQELETFTRSQSWQTNSSKEYHLEDILIALPESPTSNEIIAAEQRAKKILASLRQGLSYEKIAAAESGAANSLQNGDLGWRQLPEVPSAFAQEITQMKPNSYAGPIQTGNGFHILHLADSRPIKTKHNGLSKGEIEQMLFQRKFEESLQTWTSKLRSQAFIEIKV